jgi:integrase
MASRSMPAAIKTKQKAVKRPDGTTKEVTLYWFRVDVGKDPVTGKRIQVYKSGELLKEIKAEYARVTHENNTGTLVRPTKTTLNEYLDKWLAGRRKLEEATASNYRDALKPVRERLGKKGLQELDKEKIDELVDWMLTEGRKRGGKLGTGVGARAVVLTLGVLQQALDPAVAENKMKYNPVRLVERPKQAKIKRAPWNAEESRAFLDAIREDRLFAVMFLSLMGLRPEEACGLKWDKVDFEAKTLTIDWVRTLVDGKVVEKEPKTDAGDRTLPLPSAPAAALKKLKAKQAAEKLAAGRAYGKGGYVLCDELGEPWKTDQLRRRFYRLVDASGVRRFHMQPEGDERPRRITLYDTRHACLTYLATKAGVPDTVVSAWAGHTDLSFTKRTYIHPDAESLRAGSDALDRLFGT